MQVSIYYANHIDCDSFGAKPIPWNWGRYWVIEQINSEAETIGKLINQPSGNYIEVYRRIHQPHPFYNLICGTPELRFFYRAFILNLDDLANSDIYFDQIISWDSAPFFMDKEDRWVLWREIDKRLNEGGVIAISFLRFLNVNENLAKFMNDRQHKKINHHYRGEVSIEDFRYAPRLLKLLVEAKEKKLFHSDKELIDNIKYLSIPHLDLVNSETYTDPMKAISCLRHSLVTYQGIRFCL